MILEGIVTSCDKSGTVNVAPMGPVVDASMASLLLRPYKTSNTYRNLKERRCGVFHVVDDVLLLARAAIGDLPATPPTFAAKKVDGVVLESACRWYEFEIERFDDTEERTSLQARVVHAGRLRDFFGFNRAKHAVLEATILATRLDFLSREEVLRQFEALRVAVEKTAGPAEREAFALLERYVGDRS